MSHKLMALYVSKLNQQTQTYKFLNQKNKQIKQDLQKMPNKIKALNAKSGQRNKFKANYGVWYTMYSNGWNYAVSCNNEYPERYAYGLIEKIKETVQNKENNKCIKQINKLIQQNFNKYKDLLNIDKFYKAQTQVNILQADLQTGIRKLINNQQNINELQNHTQQIKDFAKQFEKKSNDLQSKAFWHKWRFIMIIILVVLGMIALVAVTIMIKYKT